MPSKTENLSYMVFPFYFTEALSEEDKISDITARLHKLDSIICNENTLWERKAKTIEDNVLYEYIKPNTHENSTQYLAYSLRSFTKNDPDTKARKISNAWEKLNAEMPVDRSAVTFKLDFGHEKNNWNGPTLLISPSFGVGMLVLGVNPRMKNIDIKDLIYFNYNLHKIDGQQKLFVPLDLPILKVKENEPEAEIEKKKQQLEKVEAKKREQIEALREALYPGDAENHPINNGLEFQLLDLVKMLLTGIPEWTLFEKGRAHVFTYYCFVKEELSLTAQEKEAIILLTRCIDSKYNIPIENFDNSRSFTSTFSNVYMGSSIEGGCICTIFQVDDKGKSNNPSNGFINSFATGNLQHRYLWLYFMALMQRYVMLRMVAELSDLDLYGDSSSQRETFNKRYGYFCNTKIKSAFRDVSSFSQHNQLYKFLMDNMEIDELYKEVESKMQIVDSYLQMQRNELMRKRNEQNEEQNKKINIASIILSVLMFIIAIIEAIDIIYKYL